MFDIEILNIFDVQENYKIKKPIRLIELFGGVGCQATALRYLGANFEHYRLCEFDKYAVDTYNKIHNTNFKTSDVKFISANDLGIVDKDKYEYILTYSFPCTDISLAGKRQGMERDSNTSSSLLWEVERLLNECKELPQILLMENVIQIHSQQNMASFLEWQHFLESKGYTNFWEDLNAKDFLIPQNRNRTFMISILGKDVIYSFPKKSKLKLRLKDMLEDNVDEKYYLSDKMLKCFSSNGTGKYPRRERFQQNIFKNNGLANTIITTEGSTATCNFVIEEIKNDIPICVNSKGGRKGKDGLQPSLQDRVYSLDGIMTAITVSFNPKILEEITNRRFKRKDIGILFYDGKYYYVRKLTPGEAWRLMGWKDEQIDKVDKIISNTQLYKQAGNGIVVNVLMEIFKQLL